MWFAILLLRRMLLPGQSIFFAPLLSHLTHSQLLGISSPVNCKQGLLSSQHQSPSSCSICLPLLSHLQTEYIRKNEEVTKLHFAWIWNLYPLKNNDLKSKIYVDFITFWVWALNCLRLAVTHQPIISFRIIKIFSGQQYARSCLESTKVINFTCISSVIITFTN